MTRITAFLLLLAAGLLSACGEAAPLSYATPAPPTLTAAPDLIEAGYYAGQTQAVVELAGMKTQVAATQDYAYRAGAIGLEGTAVRQSGDGTSTAIANIEQVGRVTEAANAANAARAQATQGAGQTATAAVPTAAARARAVRVDDSREWAAKAWAWVPTIAALAVTVTACVVAFGLVSWWIEKDKRAVRYAREDELYDIAFRYALAGVEIKLPGVNVEIPQIIDGKARDYPRGAGTDETRATYARSPMNRNGNPAELATAIELVEAALDYYDGDASQGAIPHHSNLIGDDGRAWGGGRWSRAVNYLRERGLVRVIDRDRTEITDRAAFSLRGLRAVLLATPSPTADSDGEENA